MHGPQVLIVEEHGYRFNDEHEGALEQSSALLSTTIAAESACRKEEMDEFCSSDESMANIFVVGLCPLVIGKTFADAKLLVLA